MNLHDVWVHPFMAGTLGALVGLRFAPGLGVVERSINVSSGALVASFLTPVATTVLSVNSPSVESGFAFILGMFGMSIMASVMTGLREVRFGEIITGWLKRRGD